MPHTTTPQYEHSDEHGSLFVGWEPRECGDHRTVGDYRAWCFDCGEWCYSREIDMACKGCEIAHLRTGWNPTPPDGGYTAEDF